MLGQDCGWRRDRPFVRGGSASWPPFILDLGGVNAIDAAGIGLLITLQAAGIYLQLLNPTRRVQEILKLTKLDSVFEICESPSDNDCITNPATNKESEPTRRDGNRSLPSLITS